MCIYELVVYLFILGTVYVLTTLHVIYIIYWASYIHQTFTYTHTTQLIYTVTLSYTYRVQEEVLQNLDVSPLAFQQVGFPPLYNTLSCTFLHFLLTLNFTASILSPYNTVLILLFPTSFPSTFQHIYLSPSFQQSMVKHQESPEVQVLFGKLQVRLYCIYYAILCYTMLYICSVYVQMLCCVYAVHTCVYTHTLCV